MIAGTCALVAGARVRRRLLSKRAEAWRSERSLTKTANALAENLAFGYGQDERWRQIRDPEPIEVAWRPRDGSGDGEGVGDGEPRLGSVARFFAASRQRLVVLGGPGAGKSVLALRLAHELLEERGPTGDEPVPVLVPLASWNPERGLFRWLAEQLAAEHPGACTPVPGAPPADVAFELLRTRRLLPVLDGFDELPPGVRKAAMRELKESLRGGHRFVLTSRVQEYQEPVREVGDDFLRDEIELCPLTDEAVAAHLNPHGRPGARWAGVLARLGDGQERSPEVTRLRETLRVPLMVTLAKVAYAREGADPGELLERARFGSRQEIEQHLYDAFLDAAYSASHDDRAANGGWDPERAREWAGFLAARMRERHEQDLAWWRLDREVPPLVRVLGLVPAYLLSIAVVAWLGFGETVVWVTAVWGTPRDGTPVQPPWTAPLWGMYAALCAAALMETWLKDRSDWHRAPYRLAPPSVRKLRQALGRRAYRVGAALAVAALATGWALGAEPRLLGAAACAIVTLVCWRALGAVWVPTDPFLARSPAALLRSDRATALGFGWLPPLRNLFLPLVVLCLPLVFLVSWSETGGRYAVDTLAWAVTVTATLVAWLSYAVTASAWGRYTAARLYLAMVGRLPLRLMRFLEDAHRRGVLRQSGGVYRFRHIELRDRMARAARERTATVPGPRPWPHRAGGAVVAGAGVVGVLVMLPAGLLTEAATGPVHTLPTACALISEQDLGHLTVRPRKPPQVATYWPPADSTRMDVCTVEEESPLARSVRVEVRTVLVEARGSAHAPARAERLLPEFPVHRGAGRVTSEDGLGDEAVLRVGPMLSNKYFESWWDGRSRNHPGRAVVTARVDNVVISVSYAEEFADHDRLTAVARILAANALRRAGLDDPATRADSRSLADVPKSGIPEEGTRFERYVDRPSRPLYGAVWEDDESSYIRKSGHPALAFRVPRHTDCAPVGDRDLRSGHQSCQGRPDLVDAGVAPDVRIDIWHRDCGAGVSCSPEEIRAFPKEMPGLERARWTNHEEATAFYAVEYTGGGERYRMSLRRGWTHGDDQPFLFAASVEVPAEQAEMAQKIVNGIFAQTCNLTPTAPGCGPG